MAVGLSSSSVWSGRMSLFEGAQASPVSVHQAVVAPLEEALRRTVLLASQTSAPGCFEAVNTLKNLINEVNAAIKGYQPTPETTFSEKTTTRCRN